MSQASSQSLGETTAAALCVLLAGQRAMRPGLSVAHDLGIPVAALPIDGECSLADAWDRAASAARLCGPRVLALSDAADERFFARSREARRDASGASGFVPVVDRAEHRGAAGTVGDLWEALSKHDPALGSALGATSGGADPMAGAFVIECSSAPCFDLAGFLGFIDRQAGRSEGRPWAVVGAAPTEAGAEERSPAGVFYLSVEALRLIPHIGYFDLKEQLLAAVIGAGGRVACWTGAPRFARIVGRDSYLDAIRLRLELGAPARADDVVVESGAVMRGASILCRGAALRERALVEDSAVLPGAIIGRGAIVARSVVPPGAVVPDGALVVDQTYAAFSGGAGGVR